MFEPSVHFVTGSVSATAAAWSYGIAALAYLVLTLRMVMEWRKSFPSALLLAATLLTVLWGASSACIALVPGQASWLAGDAADIARYLVWICFLATLIVGAGNAGGTQRTFARRRSAITLAFVVVLALAFQASSNAWTFAFELRVALAILGLLLVGGLFGRVAGNERWAIKHLCVGLAGLFAFDLVLYAGAALSARLDGDVWVARGMANVLAIPFIAVATARNPQWTIRLRVSREAVLLSTALLAAGTFLLTVAVAGYVVRRAGGDWGRVLQIELLFVAALALALAAFSGRLRAKLRVFVSKHFFSYRYDYRQEWLHFTRALSTESAQHSVQERVLMALADLVESPAAMLWLKDGECGFKPSVSWNMAQVDAVERFNAPLIQYLQRTGWVIGLDEYALAPESHPGLRLPPWLSEIPQAWLIVPLFAANEMLGFVVLGTPRTAIEVNWEVRDLLKTASRQAASYLGYLHATEALLEARKFDSFNRMSAFVVHDLKNLVAQLSLMLRNAQRHKHNPEFQRDMLATVEHVVERMNHLMLELRTGTTPLQSPRPIALEPILHRACMAKANGAGAIDIKLARDVVALGHEDRLERVIGHLIQNALDATTQGGQVSVQLDRDDRHARIDIADTGVGMSPEFIRKRLFKPFETTKTAGMGIGVYESSQYIASLGGQMLIDSKLQVGTHVCVLLPLREDSAAMALPEKEVA